MIVAEIVAPFVGAWVETDYQLINGRWVCGRALRGRVG